MKYVYILSVDRILYRYDGGLSAEKLGTLPYPGDNYRYTTSIAYSSFNDSFYVTYSVYDNGSNTAKRTYRIPKSDIVNPSYKFGNPVAARNDGTGFEYSILSVYNVPYTDIIVGSAYGLRSDKYEVTSVFNDGVRSTYGDNTFHIPGYNNLLMNVDDDSYYRFMPGMVYREEDDLVFSHLIHRIAYNPSNVHTDLVQFTYTLGNTFPNDMDFSNYSCYVYPNGYIHIDDSIRSRYVTMPIQRIGNRIFYVESAEASGTCYQYIYFTDEDYPCGSPYKVELKGYIYRRFSNSGINYDTILSITYSDGRYYLVTGKGYYEMDLTLNSNLSGSLGPLNSFPSGGITSFTGVDAIYVPKIAISVNGKSIVLNTFRTFIIDESFKTSYILYDSDLYSFALENK